MNAYASTLESERPIRQTNRISQAYNLFQQARRKAEGAKLFGMITRTCREMPSLSTRIGKRSIHRQTSIGLRTVEVKRIVGTESRSGDFDNKFYPLNDRISGRWMSIANLHLCEIGLPAVDLIQVGDEYFVRDGHHRISVANAMGQAYIDAYVTRIELA